MDEHKHKILVRFVFSMFMSKTKKIRNSFHHSQTNTKAQQEEKFNKRRSRSTRGEKLNKREENEEEIKDLKFTSIL